ncbi:10229_t:CDS:2, partial [Cetraspora pellucida]
MSERSSKSDDSKGIDVSSKPTLNVFAQPHFRTKTNTTRLSFKDFHKNVPNPNLQSPSDSSPRSIFQLDSSSDISLFSKTFPTKQDNSETELEECTTEQNSIQEISTNDDSAVLPELNPLCPTHSDEELPLQSDSIHMKDLQIGQTDMEINDCSIESRIIQNPQEVDLSLKDNQNPSSEVFSSSSNQLDLSSVDECMPINVPTSNFMKSCFQINSKNPRNNAKIDDLHKENEGDDLGIIIEVAHRWKKEVSRKDSLIKELHDEIHRLKKTIEQRGHSLSLYIERMFIVEALIKRQQTYTDHNRERIEKMKSKYYLYRNSLSNMLKRMEEVRDEKNRIESEIGSLKCEFDKLATQHKSISESHASNFQSQQSQIAQITDLNTHLTESNAQLNNVIVQLRQLIQDSDTKSSCYASELESTREKLEALLRERGTERMEHMNKCQNIESLLKLSEDNNKALSTNRKENEKRIAQLEFQLNELESGREKLEVLLRERDTERMANTNKCQNLESLLKLSEDNNKALTTNQKENEERIVQLEFQLSELESTREKLEVLLRERDTERMAHINECQNLESLLKLSEDNNKALTTNQKENEE